jgi:hypothetical protein
MPSRAVLGLALSVAFCALAAQAGAARPVAALGACTTTASAPFLYSVVIPVSAVQCDSTQRRLRIETQLTRDGLAVASSFRTCRDATVCWLTVDASAPDEPGDQVWCTVAAGYVGATFVGKATACEADSTF